MPPLRLDDLVPNPGAHKKRKRVGRGTGSGHGKTSGRGTKGQQARGAVRRGFEGGQLPIQRRLPYKRGFTNIHKTRWEVINLGRLAELGTDETITPDLLYRRGVIRGLEFPVKILGDGKLDGAVTVVAHAFSEGAKAAIEAAGGATETLERTDRWVSARPRSRRLPLNAALKDAGVGKVGGPKRADAVATLKTAQGSGGD